MGEGIERASLAWLDKGWKWEEMGGVKQEPGQRDLLKENRVERRLNLWRGKASLSTCPHPDMLPDMARKSLPCHPNTTHKTPQPPTHPNTMCKTPLPTCHHAISTQYATPRHHRLPRHRQRTAMPPQHGTQDHTTLPQHGCKAPSPLTRHATQDPTIANPSSP
ncbi:hypothetical protein EDB89DRAFT_1906352 [Lactarius sanguifluus]|nr:hypothetical protein EDB89DRAFT_1906352 [Lactarius sanguifluus]